MKIKIRRNGAKVRIQKTQPRYWSCHTHTKFSAGDAMPTVAEVVARAKELGYQGLGITDHGNMAASLQLYTECKKAGIKPFPGTEIYLVMDRSDLRAKRYHACILAYSTEGYRNLIYLNTRSHEQFHHKPILDLADLADAFAQGKTAGLALTTGCFFGLVTQTLITEGYVAARRVVASLASWFPPGSTYVEIQNHRIEREGQMSEVEIEEQLLKIATELDLPVVMTQDSHYTHPEHREEHDALKRMVAFGSDVDDAVFPGDGYHMVDDAWMRAHHTKEGYERGLQGLDRLLASHVLTIPELDSYRYLVPNTTAHPETTLYDRCYQALKDRGLASKPAYMARFYEEMETIRISGMAGYLTLVAEVTDFCADRKIFFQARGSASGSLLCWLLGITSVDPLKWGLLMERFLSKDRTKPPDIDLDVEHTRRQELIDWLSERFVVEQIGTWITMSMDDDSGEGVGSLVVKYFSSLRKQGKEPSWKDLSPEDREMMSKLSGRSLFSGSGTHPAGLLMTTTRAEMDDLVPMMCIPGPNKTRKFVSQYDMGDVEKIGLVKLDVLGVKTMTVLRMTIEALGRDPGERLDFIPLTDSKTYTSISRGRTAGVFQLDGRTATRGMRELKPTKIADIVAAMALYRPATMKSGATDAYVHRRHGVAQAPARHEIIARHTNQTYGVLLYQEQVISVLRDLGMPTDDLMRFLKAIKSSNANVTEAAGEIASMLGDVEDMSRDKGMSEEDLTWLKSALQAYADYGFNKAHSVVYGLTAYRTAYLATNHPVEFFSALLSVHASTDKEPVFVTAARDAGVRIAKPDVNKSGTLYRVDRTNNSVRRGLRSIKGIGEAACEEIVANQPFSSLDDLVERCNPRVVTGIRPLMGKKTDPLSVVREGSAVGVVARLYEAGALNSILKEEQ